jgi:hypothetical protein
MADILLPTLNTWGAVCQDVWDPVAEVFSPKVMSLVTEQHSHIGVPLVQMGEDSV